MLELIMTWIFIKIVIVLCVGVVIGSWIYSEKFVKSETKKKNHHH